MATAEQDKKNPASEQEYEDVTVAEHDYETLTRENNGYAKLSDLQLLDSGSFENPEVLDKHPWQHDRLKMKLPLNKMQDTPQVLVTPVDSCEGLPLKSKDIDQVVTFQRKLTPPTVMPYSESESEDEDVSPDPIEQNRERTESDTINILGSLCLQGVMQGLVEHDTERRILPDSIRMTVNLEEHCAALDQLSVMVTKNLEIVPETPFDANARQREPSSSHSAPFRRFRAKTQLSERPHTVAGGSKIEVHVTNVTYIDHIARPQPLPPLSDKLPLTERKRYKVVESLLESEAAFLTSLNIAIKLYKNPLKETANTELTNDQIKYLFGPIVPILEHHELFYSALSEQTKDWSPAKQIGNSFLASFNRKDVLKHYSKYVNNFTKAMSILEKAIKKKHKFYDFLKQQMTVTPTPLSLQALLLKPIQRFPQYILFLKDLIKYTPSSHPDSVVLQMAYAYIEGIANSLNEAKHRSEQLTIVSYLNSKIEKLPVNLVKTNQTLVRQDIIQWTRCKNGKWTSKERQLFLFNKILICCAVHQNKKARNDPERRTSRIEAEQVIGGDTSSTPSLVCKWYCPIESVEMTYPDYIKDNTPLVTIESEDSEIQTKFEELQKEMKKLDSDFQLLSKIGGLVASLHDTYESLSVQSIQNYCRILQRKLEGVHELMKSCEPCRVDITIPGKGNDSMSRYHHVLLFESEGARQNWVRDIHMTKLRQNKENQQPWIIIEDNTDDIDEDDDDLEGKGALDKYAFSDNFPLVIDYMKLCHNSEVSSVESATNVGSNRVWFASGNATSSYISIVRCFLPTPILVETFPVSSNKILCMKTIPATDGLLNVWMGSQCGKLMLYDAATKKCLQTVQLPDSILCIENYKNRVFIGAANGQLFVYSRTKGSHWDLKKCNHQIPVASSAIQCFCIVDDFLWMGIQKSCVLINTSSLQLEHGVKVTNDDSMYVKRLEKSGAGIWVALSRGATLYLYHKDTRKPIQEIDIQGSLANIIGYANIGSKFGSLSSLHITALAAAAGYLWVGSSVGATLVYRIPHVHGLPLLNGRPFLASDGHKGTVRVLTAIQTKVDVSSVRFDQFVSDEKERMIGSFTIKSSQPLEEVSPDETTLIQSTAVDDRALPRVSQVIQKLELGKQLLKSSVHDQSSLEAQNMSSLPKPVIKKAVSSKPVPKPRTKKPKEKIVPNITTPADYETPQNLIDTLTQDDPEHVYDDVPFEYDESDEEETIERSSSVSEVAIDRSRYESNTIQFGDSLYERIGLNTITMTIPDHQVTQEQSSTFVFTGGTGLVDFRHGEPSSLQQKSQLIMSLNDPSHLNEVPCVITYQVPK